ncbi:elongation factor P [Candidatus Pantoea edessiphila]|uniref:Elongation factor P n=1 Tax=Candidatus Pantoea edessiphila TaxID=2044610 RepID=A0A2P5SY95_9GAMM|nr:elongation factor P [Candidatus Pantoea edessiphila]MBK4775659.1 elongation factor P [Pantoea sp. Edef]PPI87304.1 elongation factor P [Candidatus Pantoea edessiphila]
MITYFSNNFRNGLKIIFDNEPYAIESSEFVKPGKGQAFVRVKMRRLLTGTRIEKTFKSTDSLQSADIMDTKLIYLYNDNEFYYFMYPENFEHLQVHKKTIGESTKWMQENVEYIITLWNETPINIQVPKFIEVKIIRTDPGLKGDTVGTSSKLAILSTGAVIKVPLFLKTGETIKVDTRSGEYVSRIK